MFFKVRDFSSAMEHTWLLQNTYKRWNFTRSLRYGDTSNDNLSSLNNQDIFRAELEFIVLSKRFRI